MLRKVLAAAAVALLAVPAFAQEAGLAVILDAQNADVVAQKYCVYDSKLFTPNAEICITKVRKLTCQPADPNDVTKGLTWAASDDNKRCASQ
ncbi:MAG: hypothetical protein HXY22_08455 [Alphaproteobacteria bacterium]|nr:hypothetical protein [Alphaproteobacteria bacterium]